SLGFKTPGHFSLAGIASPSTATRADPADALNVKPTSERPIKPLRLFKRPTKGPEVPINDSPRTDVPMMVDEAGPSAPIQRSGSTSHPSSRPLPASASIISGDDSPNDAMSRDRCSSPIEEPPVIEASHDENVAESSEDSISVRDLPIENGTEGNIAPAEQSEDEVDELDSEDDLDQILGGVFATEDDDNQENNRDRQSRTADPEVCAFRFPFLRATDEHLKAESSDSESDFSDTIHEAKASQYSLSNASAAAEIEKELEASSDPEVQPQAPLGRRGPPLLASTAAFGLHGSVGPRAGRSTSPTARLGPLSSALSSYSISGLDNAGGSAAVSQAGGESAEDEDEEDISPLL
ncbi:hypothetical protein FRC01_013344, partial [Tulasnella sp. 417]